MTESKFTKQLYYGNDSFRKLADILISSLSDNG